MTDSAHSPAALSQAIKAKAAELGFDACGISPAVPLDDDRSRLVGWLGSGYHGTMGYMADHLEKRTNPALLVEGAQSVVSVLLNYFTTQKQRDPNAPVISKYAFGQDYHYALKERLARLLTYIREDLAPCEGRAFADSAPLLEKALARQAGLGWIGKNSLLIHPRKGSFHFIGELVLNLELDYDQPFGNSLCGSCSRCIDSCPTGALIGPSLLDATRCISYLTIETKEEVSEPLAQKLTNRLVGCDICQDVCPWNGKALPNLVPEFRPKAEMLEMSASEWKNLEKPTYNRLFRGTAVERTGFTRMKRTLSYLPDKK